MYCAIGLEWKKYCVAVCHWRCQMSAKYFEIKKKQKKNNWLEHNSQKVKQK